MRPFFSLVLPALITPALCVQPVVAAPIQQQEALPTIKQVVQDWFFPMTMVLAVTKNSFEWQFAGAAPEVKKQFAESLDKKNWVKAELLTQHVFTEQGQKKCLVLLRQQPMQFKQALGENIVGWIDGAIFVEKEGKWEKESSGYNLAYVSSTPFKPATDFRMITLGLKQNAFVITQNTTSGDVSLERTEYYISVVKKSLRKIAEIIVVQQNASPEVDGTFQNSQTTVEPVAPQLDGFSPLRVKTTYQWKTEKKKTVRQQTETTLYAFNPKKGEYDISAKPASPK